MAWEDGFKVGYEMNKVEIPSMNANLAAYQKTINVNKQVQAQREQAQMDSMEKYLNAANKRADDSLFSINFDSTGIANADISVDKLSKSLGEISAYNNWRYRRGEMSEDEHTKAQRLLVSNVTKFSGFYNEIDERNKAIGELQASGNDNKVNGFRSEILEFTLNNLSVSAKPEGSMLMSTIDNDGNVISGGPSMMQSLLNVDQGVNIDAALEDIIDDKGDFEKLNAVTGVKTVKYNINTEMVRPLVEVQVKGFTEAQIVDAAFDLSIVTDDEKEAERKGIEYINATKWVSFTPEKINELKEQVIGAMEKYTLEKYDLKFGSKALAPKSVEESLFSSPITFEAKEDTSSIVNTFFESQSYKDLTNTTNPLADPNMKEDRKAAFVKFNSDLVEDEIKYDENNKETSRKKVVIDPSKLSINAVNVPIPFSAKEIMGLGVNSSSKKQWDNIDGFVVVKRKTPYIPDPGEPERHQYSIRVRGSVISDTENTKVETGTPQIGSGTNVSAQVKEQSFDRTDDISAPINDADLTRVWGVFIGKNEQLKKAYTKAFARATKENLNTSDVNVSRTIIGKTLEEFFTK
jgi:hypothetical protein